MASPAFSACTQCVFDSSHFFYCYPASFYQFHVAFCQQSSGNCNRHLPFLHFQLEPTSQFTLFSFHFWLVCAPLLFPLIYSRFQVISAAIQHFMFAFRFRPRWFSRHQSQSPWCEHLSFDFGAATRFGFGFIYVYRIFVVFLGFYFFGFCFWFAVLNRWRRLRSLFAALHAAPQMLSPMQLINSLQLFMLLLQLLLLLFSLWFLGFVRPSARNWKQRGVAAVAAVAYCGIWILNFASSPSWLKLMVSVAMSNYCRIACQRAID